MGRSQPTTRNLIEKRREDMKNYRRMLRKQHQEDFDWLFEKAMYDAPWIKAAGSLDVSFGILFAICRGQQRELEELREALDDDCPLRPFPGFRGDRRSKPSLNPG